MTTDRQQARCRERLQRLCSSSLDPAAIQREAIAELRRVIGFDRWCWPLADPETLIPLAGIAEHDYGPAVARSLELEYSGSDFATMHVLGRHPNPVASLSAETRGDLARSPRWDEVLRPVGIGDEAAMACRDALGCWGWLKAYRDSDEAPFAERDLELLAQVGPSLGTALRRRFDDLAAHAAAAPAPAGMVILDRDLRLVSWTPGARRWLDRLPLAALFASWGMLPAVVYPLAALARSDHARNGAHAVERTVDDGWVTIEAAPLEGGEHAGIAVALRHASPSETFDLLARAYALTRRERELVAAIIAGLDTRAVSERLTISRYTVQDHLKSVFGKVGVRSRRELLARFGAYAEAL